MKRDIAANVMYKDDEVVADDHNGNDAEVGVLR